MGVVRRDASFVQQKQAGALFSLSLSHQQNAATCSKQQRVLQSCAKPQANTTHPTQDIKQSIYKKRTRYWRIGSDCTAGLALGSFFSSFFSAAAAGDLSCSGAEAAGVC